jgi:hypothetical protein
MLLTYPEVNPYGVRTDVGYVGLLPGALRVERVDWLTGDWGIFACLRPDTYQIDAIL